MHVYEYMRASLKNEGCVAKGLCRQIYVRSEIPIWKTGVGASARQAIIGKMWMSTGSRVCSFMCCHLLSARPAIWQRVIRFFMYVCRYVCTHVHIYPVF